MLDKWEVRLYEIIKYIHGCATITWKCYVDPPQPHSVVGADLFYKHSFNIFYYIVI